MQHLGVVITRSLVISSISALWSGEEGKLRGWLAGSSPD